MKKITLIILAVLFSILMLLGILPFMLKGKITEIAKKELNKQILAEADFKSVNISLIRDFPNAALSLNDFYLAGKDAFEGDTLIQSKELKLVVNMKSLFGSKDIEVKKVVVDKSKIYAHELMDGRVNWDIFPPDSVETVDEDSPMKFLLKDVRIQKADIIYVSDTSRVAAKLINTNIRLDGDFTTDHSVLNTALSIDSLSFWSDGVQLAHNLAFDFKALIDAVFTEYKYELKDNSMKINAVPLSLDGWVQLPEEGIAMDLKLNSEKVDFKSLLSLIPAVYAKDFEQLRAEGKVSLSGYLKGLMFGENYPAFDLDLLVQDGKIQYPDLPRALENVNLAAKITHPGGLLDLTEVDVSNLKFSLGGNPFLAKMQLKNLISDPDFHINALGKLDLGMIKDFYPLEKGTELNGVLDMDLDAAGRMSYVEQNRYESFRFAGLMTVRDVLLKTEELPQDVKVQKAELKFNNRYLLVPELLMQIGRNDLQLNGQVENYLAYVLHDKTLKGEFKLNSNYLNLNDLMADSEEGDSAMQLIEVPKNLNLALSGKIAQLFFAEMELKDAEAQFQLLDGELGIRQMKVNAFGGKMALDGKYSTKDITKPLVDFDVDLKEVSFAELFKQVETLRKFAPVFEKLDGRFNTKLSLNTLLAGDMVPILTSVLSQGSFKADFITLKQEIGALNALASELKIDKLTNLSVKDIKLGFSIKDGRLLTNPFQLKLKDYAMQIGGSTGLDQSIDYAGTFRLPDNLNLGRFQNVGFKIGGDFSKPKVQLDLKETLTSLLDEEKGKAMAKVDSVKTDLLDKGRAERDKAIEEAEKKAAQLLTQAQEQTNRILKEARVQGDSLVAKAKNPIAKELARKAADELLRQAGKKAEEVNSRAKTEGDKLISTAKEKSDF